MCVYICLCCYLNAVNLNGTQSVVIGNRDWLRTNGTEVSEAMDRIMEEHESLGHSAVLCAVNSKRILQGLSRICMSCHFGNCSISCQCFL